MTRALSLVMGDVYCTISVNVVLCVSEPLLAVTVTWKLPVGVPVSTLKFTGLETPPPGEGLVTTTGNVPVAARSLVDSGMDSCDPPK